MFKHGIQTPWILVLDASQNLYALHPAQLDEDDYLASDSESEDDVAGESSGLVTPKKMAMMEKDVFDICPPTVAFSLGHISLLNKAILDADQPVVTQPMLDVVTWSSTPIWDI